MYLPVDNTNSSSSYMMAIASSPSSSGINWLLLTLGVGFGCCVFGGLIGVVVYIYKKHPELRMGGLEPEKKEEEPNEEKPLLKKNT